MANVMDKEAARIIAIAECLTKSKGKLLQLPKELSGAYALWSGLIVSLSGEKVAGEEITCIDYLDGSTYRIPLPLSDVASKIGTA